MTRWLRSLTLSALSAVALVGGTASAETYRGSVPIARANLNLVEMAPDVKVYPGETVTVTASGSANVNQHNYEKRRCKYAGLKCWYENRSDTQIAPANDFEIEVALVEADGTVIVRKMIAGGTLAALLLPLEGRRFDQGVSLRAFIKTFRGATIYRASCANRPKYCSSGDLTLIISSSDTTKRVGEVARQFAGFSANAVPAERIRSRDYLDTLLLDTEGRKFEAQKLIAGYVETWVSNADPNSQAGIVELVQFALKLSDDHDNLTKLNRARMDAFAKQGNYEALELDAAREFNRLKQQCSDEQCSISDARHMAATLKSLATAQAEKQARFKTSDIALAVATLNRGIDILERALENQEIVGLKSHLVVLSDLYQDASNMLSLMRTPAEVRKAVGFMERSVCLHRLSLKTAAPGTNYSSAVCRTAGG